MRTYTLLLISLFFLLDGCATNPVTGKRDFMLLSEKQEIAMGKESDPAIVATFGLYEDKELQQFITAKGKEMAAVSHRPDLPYEFKVVDSKVVNAFAVPGGFIYFTRGIMAHFNNEAEFAGVLGHEIGHVTARHSAQQYSKSQAASLGLGVGMIFSDTFRQFGDLAAQGMQLMFLKFGRDDERESDQLGVEYSTKIGYDAYEMAGFFETLDRLSPSDAEALPSFLSTHPDPAERSEDVRRAVEKWRSKTDFNEFEVNRNAYLRMIDGMVYGDDPRQGYLENSRFYHPELKFVFEVPTGWKLQNSPQQVQMAPEGGKAVMIFTLVDGDSPQKAAEELTSKYELVVEEQGSDNINGFSAYQVVASQQDESGNVIRIQFYFIQDGERMYAMYGAAAGEDFKTYQSVFIRSMTSFSRLSDPKFLNRNPTRIKIREVRTTALLEKVLLSFGTPGDKLEELGVLNGMELSDEVLAGTLIKTVSTD